MEVILLLIIHGLVVSSLFLWSAISNVWMRMRQRDRENEKMKKEVEIMRQKLNYMSTVERGEVVEVVEVVKE